MNIFHRIIHRTMRANRTRTLVTIVGVALSAAMFTAMTTFTVSLSAFLENAYRYQNGDWHIAFEDIRDTTVEQIAADPETEQMAVAEYVGYAQVESENDGKPYLYVTAADDNFLKAMPVHVTTGRLPQSADEILLPEHLSYNGGVAYQLGDVLRLSVGDRTAAGWMLNQNQVYAPEEASETLENLRSLTYTVTGFYERPAFENYSAPGYTALTVRGGQNRTGVWYDAYVKIDRPTLETVSSFRNRYDSGDGTVTEMNRELLMFSGVFGYSNISAAVFGLMLIFGGLTLFASVSLIHSAFSVSVSERIRQFGLLSSIGATRRQIRGSVFYEAFLISALGIPCGIAVGLAGMAVTLALIGDRFLSLIEAPEGMRLCVTPLSVAGAALIAAVTVGISVWFPARRAMRVTAIEAVRQNREIALQGKNVRISGRFVRLFGIEGVLGRKYFLRSRRRYRGTVMSLAFSVILFIAAGFFGRMLSESVESSLLAENFDASYTALKEMDEGLLSELRKAEGVAEVVCSAQIGRRASIREEEADDTYWQIIREDAQNGQTEEGILSGDPHLGVCNICYLDEASYQKLLDEAGVGDASYRTEAHPLPLFVNQGTVLRWYGSERKSYETEFLKDGVDEMELISNVKEEPDGYCYVNTGWEKDEKGNGRFVDRYIRSDRDEWEYGADDELIYDLCIPAQTETVLLGERIPVKPLGLATISDNPALIYPYRALEDAQATDINLYFRAEDYDTMMENVRRIIEEHGYSTSDSYFFNPMDEARSQRSIVTIVQVFSYGFVVMVTLIALANVFHTVSTNIALRRRDFAMLQSLGMQKSGIRRMLRYECLIYGLRALLWGIPVAAAASLGIYVVVQGIISRDYRFPTAAAAAAAVGVFLIVWLTMRFALWRQRRTNPVDELKE